MQDREGAEWTDGWLTWPVKRRAGPGRGPILRTGWVLPGICSHTLIESHIHTEYIFLFSKGWFSSFFISFIIFLERESEREREQRDISSCGSLPTLKSQGLTRSKRAILPSSPVWQWGPNCLRRHLLPPSMYISRQVELGKQPEHDPRNSNIGCRLPK